MRKGHQIVKLLINLTRDTAIVYASLRFKTEKSRILKDYIRSI